MNQRYLMLAGVAVVALLTLSLFSFSPSAAANLSPHARAAAVGEILSPLTLRPDERIEIDYVADGCRNLNNWTFVLWGGPERRLAVIDAGGSYEPGMTVSSHPAPIGAITLTERECMGLHDLMQLYRHPNQRETSTTTVRIGVSYFRGSTRVGAEQFTDHGAVDNWVYTREYGELIPALRGATAELVSLPKLFRLTAQTAQPAKPVRAAVTEP